MKLWLKIYLFSLLLLIFTLNTAGFILIQKLNNDLLNNEIERCMSEQKLVSLQLKINSVSFEKDLNEDNKMNTPISILMQEYNSSIDNKAESHGYIEILDLEDETLYKDISFPLADNNDELENLSIGKSNYIIKTINDREYLYICSLANVYNSQLKIHYAKDISNLYIEKMNRYIVFIKLSIIGCSFFAVFMFFISRLITKPINTLIESTEKISQGEYSERVRIKSKDEFKVLSEDFNRMAETIEEKINDLERSNNDKETLINNLTHELKTPLTSIIGYANIIRTSKYDEELFFECADYIYKQGKRLENMTFKMMDLIYSRTQKVKLINQNIMPIIYEVKKVLSIRLDEKNIELSIKGYDCRLDLDKDLISMVICNLVDNAIKASKSNSKISIKIYQEKDKTFVSVEDSGMGIPEEHLNKICQPFYVVDKARSRKNNGAGIGLSICRKVAEIHNADMEIKSEVGVGTQVTIIFYKRGAAENKEVDRTAERD